MRTHLPFGTLTLALTEYVPPDAAAAAAAAAPAADRVARLTAAPAAR